MPPHNAHLRDTLHSECLFFIQRNGLRLHVAHSYPSRTLDELSHSSLRPVICLPGLTRNTKDFDELARALSTGSNPRHVYALDSRGRGLSDYDPDWRNYNVTTEAQDVLDFIFTYGLEKSAILGTSRGGLLAMVLAAIQPGVLGPVILNDIGPVIEEKGLSRIALYVGRTPLPHSWSDAGNLVRQMNIKSFPAIPNEEWPAIARQIFNDKKGRPAPAYDPHLSNVIGGLKGAPPQLWAQFEALRPIPVMVLRGGNSDILSEETVQAMSLRHPRLKHLTIPGQGHAPWLRDRETIGAISTFLEATDRVA